MRAVNRRAATLLAIPSPRTSPAHEHRRPPHPSAPRFNMAVTPHKPKTSHPLQQRPAHAVHARPPPAVHPTLTHQNMITYVEQDPSINYSPSKIANPKRS